MAEEKKPARRSGKEEFYGGKKDADAEPAAEKKEPAEKKGPAEADGGMAGRHKAERETLRRAHETERRDEHNRQRDEHRAMNARHEDEYGGAGDHAAAVALNRKHEHEKHGLRSEHEKRHKDMAERHHHERHTLNTKHEAEMLGAAGAAPAAAEMPASEAA